MPDALQQVQLQQQFGEFAAKYRLDRIPQLIYDACVSVPGVEKRRNEGRDRSLDDFLIKDDDTLKLTVSNALYNSISRFIGEIFNLTPAAYVLATQASDPQGQNVIDALVLQYFRLERKRLVSKFQGYDTLGRAEVNEIFQPHYSAYLQEVQGAFQRSLGASE